MFFFVVLIYGVYYDGIVEYFIGGVVFLRVSCVWFVVVLFVSCAG